MTFGHNPRYSSGGSPGRWFDRGLGVTMAIMFIFLLYSIWRVVSYYY